MLALAIVAEGDGACKIAFCRVCLAPFRDNIGKGGKRKVCSYCKPTWSKAWWAEYRIKQAAAKLPKPLPPPPKTYECQNCHQTFLPKKPDRTSFCSRDCAFKHKIQTAKIRQESIWPSSPVFFVNCQRCSQTFASDRKGRKYCGDACKRAATLDHLRSRSAKAKPVRQICCKECGTLFVTEYGQKRSVFCSALCLKRYNRRIRKPLERARKKAATVEAVDPFKVFERDGWRCQICHKRTPKRLRGSLNDMAPELDHIVPLAKGGEHSYRNTQCACRRCNRTKSATVYGQLVLFGQ